jgi:hypothetical protein
MLTSRKRTLVCLHLFPPLPVGSTTKQVSLRWNFRPVNFSAQSLLLTSLILQKRDIKLKSHWANVSSCPVPVP